MTVDCETLDGLYRLRAGQPIYRRHVEAIEWEAARDPALLDGTGYTIAQIRALPCADPVETEEQVVDTVMARLVFYKKGLARAVDAVRDAATPAGREQAQLRLRELRGQYRIADEVDLAAETAQLLPVIRAAMQGTSPRWRLVRGHICDEKGCRLEPMCLRPWQRL